ncbi:hypothetical protein V8F20_004740 [Naviculisporaceae sp. PSN 640]
MMLSHCRRPYRILLLLLAPPGFCQSDQAVSGSQFDICKDRLDRILNGTLVFNDIDNITIHRYLYHGPVGGMRPEYARIYRETFITITTEGCKAICEDPVDWYWISDPSLTLGIVSNWILPIIALLAALPFDNGHGKQTRGRKRKRARDTVRAVWNWLGSPQTALTATFFNIHQMRVCLDATNAPPGESLFGVEDKAVARDAFYVLSCIGQFDLPETEAGLECFLQAVVYGLFKPAGPQPRSSSEPYVVAQAADMVISDNAHTAQAQRWTRDLLRAMARQMRRSRRLGIYSTLASIFLFFVAYAASVVLAFAEGLGERTTTHSLAFGILITWLPLLLLFSILDRNPNSADRTRDFAHRWLWNVRAVREWEREMTRLMEQDPPPRSEDLPQPYWWTRKRERERDTLGSAINGDVTKTQNTTVTERELDVCCGVRVTPRQQCHHELGSFVGQGRKMGYYGLALSVVNTVRRRRTWKVRVLELLRWPASDEEAAVTTPGIAEGLYNTLAENTRSNLRHRPSLWWKLLALTALALVWWELGTALMISYNIPTVGIGCRSGSYLVYGGLSTVPWVAHVYRYLVLGPSHGGSQSASTRKGWIRRLGEWVGMILDALSAFCMLMAVPCLIFITFAAFSGVLKNCACRGGLNQYIDFQSATFYSDPDIFDVRKWWIAAAATAAVPVVLSFVVALPVLVFKMQPLWQEDQDQEGGELESEEIENTESEEAPLLGADMEWVAR